MALKIIYFVHGTTTDNEAGIASGWSDVDLSPLGVQQSKDLPKLNTDKFDVVFCSDLRRAIHSAELSFKDKFPIIQDSRLRECNYGDLNGKDGKIVEETEIDAIENGFPNGESYQDVEARMRDFLEEIKKKYDSKHIAIVAHKAPQLALDVILKNKTWLEAFVSDWRKVGHWQPGWEYKILKR